MLARSAGQRTLLLNGNRCSGELRADKLGHVGPLRGERPGVRVIYAVVAVVGHHVAGTEKLGPQDRLQHSLVPPGL